jgi:hypothetical protein
MRLKADLVIQLKIRAPLELVLTYPIRDFVCRVYQKQTTNCGFLYHIINI